jgi:hypothetical protein
MSDLESYATGSASARDRLEMPAHSRMYTYDSVADAALVLLAGQTGRSWEQWRVSSEDGQMLRVNREKARVYLGRVAKPAACEISASEDTASLLCGPLTDEESVAHARWVSDFHRGMGFFESLGAKDGWRSGFRVLVQSPLGQTTLNAREFDALVSDYYFRGNVAFGLREPKPFEVHLGVHAIFESSYYEIYEGPIPPIS